MEYIGRHKVLVLPQVTLEDGDYAASQKTVPSHAKPFLCLQAKETSVIWPGRTIPTTGIADSIS